MDLGVSWVAVKNSVEKSGAGYVESVMLKIRHCLHVQSEHPWPACRMSPLNLNHRLNRWEIEIRTMFPIQNVFSICWSEK
jgi:hypothetical protein